MNDSATGQNGDLKARWDESYERLENTLFYPSEAVIRFVSKHIRRRTGVASYTREFETPPDILEIGSGSGRHLAFLAKIGFRPVGIELSAVACRQAHELLAYEGVRPGEYDILNISCTDLPYADGEFDFTISVSSLDSMPRSTAVSAISEIHRTLKPGGLCFVDLIADDAIRAGGIDALGDQIVEETHEKGTIQSYYNLTKIESAFDAFRIIDIYKTVNVSREGHNLSARYFVTLEK